MILRNKVIKLIHNAKETQYQTFIDNNKGNPCSIYNIFQEAWAGKGQRKQSTIASVRVGDTHIYDSTGMANEFNNFFVNIASKLKETVTSSNHEKVREYSVRQSFLWKKIIIQSIQKEKISKFLFNIDINKATCIYMIGTHLLKLAAPFITDEITFICNHSISNSVFPIKWKEAKVTPYIKMVLMRK